MKVYAVKVGFLGSDRKKVLYSKYYRIREESEERAALFVENSLSVIEFHNFMIAEVKEIET